MKPFISFTFLCIFMTGILLTSKISSQTIPSSTTTDTLMPSGDATKAIMAILKVHEEKWNQHDIGAWAEILHEDADWVNWRGGYWHGKAAIKTGTQAIHSTYYKASILGPQRVEDLIFLTPEIVLAHVRGSLSGDERAPGKTFQYRKTILFTKKNGVWLIRALHNTRLDGVN